MANLLPQEVKKKLRREYTHRLIAVTLLAISGVLVVAILSLAPTYIVLQAEKNSLHEIKESLAVAEKTDPSTIISEMKKEVNLLKQDTYSRNIPYDIFVTLFRVAAGNIKINRVSFSVNDNSLYITGVAATGEDLKLFIDRIEEEKTFLPVENFPYTGFFTPGEVPFDFSIKLIET